MLNVVEQNKFLKMMLITISSTTLGLILAFSYFAMVKNVMDIRAILIASSASNLFLSFYWGFILVMMQKN